LPETAGLVSINETLILSIPVWKSVMVSRPPLPTGLSLAEKYMK